MTATVLLAALGVLGSVIPAVDNFASLGMLVLGALAVVVVAVRLLVRFVRERIEDAADARTAAAWRAAHAARDRTPAGVA